MHGKRCSQQQTLTLTAAELVQLIAFAPRQAYILERLSGALFNLMRRKAVVKQAEGNFLAGSQRNQLAFVVFHNKAHAHSNITDALALSAFAVNFNIAAVASAHVIGDDTGHSLAQRCLAGTTRSGDNGEAAFFDFKVDITQHQIRFFIGKVKILYVDYAFHYFSSS